MDVPPRYLKIFKDFAVEYDFAYLDSLAFAIAWRNQAKIDLNDKRGIIFSKYIGTLVENFYEKYERPEARERKNLELGFQFARWLLKTPLDYYPPIPFHSELGDLFE